MVSRLELTREIPQTIVSAGELLNNMKQAQVTSSLTFGVPVTWGELKIATKDKTSKEWARPDVINFSDLPVVQPYLFDTAQEVLEQTVSALSQVGINQLESMKIQRIQFGQLAYIFLCEARVEGKPVRFVSYLARGPHERAASGFGGESLSEIAVNDYDSLHYLSRQFDILATPTVRERFDVIRPIALGKIKFKDEHYALFTMPFVPYGELGLESEEFIKESRPDDSYQMLHFKYALPYNKQMARVNRDQSESAIRRGKVFFLGKHTPEQMITNPDVVSYTRQKEDYVLGEMLAHLVSGGMFPTQHLVNAGDWMGMISSKGLRMKLITIRGKLSPISKRDFIRHLLSHTEKLWTGHSFVEVPIFRDLDPQKLEQLYDEAERLLNT
ncbi:hypothetical protein HY357_04445 [Candidatus Roizmanbacteria bacterium]|nr:hypothetical protein [Candidatus Roizmanbacteria bacterium]